MGAGLLCGQSRVGGGSTSRLRFVLILLLPGGSFAQTLSVDWSSVRVQSDGRTSSPRVLAPEPEPDTSPSISKLLGYFANADGFFGRPGFVEFQRVMQDDDGRLVALKVVGDANVPRDMLTWRSEPGQVDAPTWHMTVQLRSRDDPREPRGFWWSPPVYELEWERSLEAFDITGAAPREGHRGHFFRVTEAEALTAANTIEDAP